MAIDFPSSPTVGQLYVFGGVTYVFTASGVWSTSGAGLSVIPLGTWTPQGRLTLQTNVPVMTTTQAAKTTLFYTPYAGNQIPLYDGTSTTMTAFAELSALTTDTTKSPAAIGASKVNDWFVWSDAGTIRVGHGPDWTSDTVRSAGTALVMVNGILLNSVSITNGPAASRGTYVGTTRSNASSQLDWIYGTNATNGGAALLNVWNVYNRVDVATFVGDTTSNWAYSVASTWRAANNSAANRVSFIRGLDEDAMQALYLLTVGAPSAGNVGVGVGLDTTTNFSGQSVFEYGLGGGGVAMSAGYVGLPGVGYHFISALEFVTSTSPATFWGAQPYAQSGLRVNGKF